MMHLVNFKIDSIQERTLDQTTRITGLKWNKK